MPKKNSKSRVKQRARPLMTKAEARAFKRRWRIVNRAEIAQLRATSMEKGLRQVAALMASVDAMGWREVLSEDVDMVRRRWLRLKGLFSERR